MVLQTVQTLTYVTGALLLALMVCLSLPSSKLREFLVPILGWAMAALCGVYVISPLDALPDVIPVLGWIDDAGAVVTGVGCAIAAITAKSK